MERRRSRIWVDPTFKRKLKKETAERDISILEYTKMLGEDQDESLLSKCKKKKKGGMFGDLKF